MIAVDEWKTGEVVSESIRSTLDAQRTAFRREGLPSLGVRLDRLTRLSKAVLQHEDRLIDALYADFGGRSRFSSRTGDILGTVAAVDYTKANLAEWMKPVRVALPAEVEQQGTWAEVLYEPLGVVGAIVPWNGPVLLASIAAAGAFGAGNRVMLKLSEFAPKTAEALKTAYAEFFDRSELAVFTGDGSVAAEFAAQPFDHLLFTGSSAIGKRVMRAAAENLVPVTLEMGGKSPVVIGRGADPEGTANRIVTGKLASAGQVCVAPDYVLVPKGQAEKWIAAFRKAAAAIYPDLLRNEDYTAVIDQRNFARLRSLLEDAKEKGATLHFHPEEASLETLGEKGRFPFVILNGAKPDTRVMQEEIFGPLLPVIEFEDLSEALDEIRRNERPLSAYYFGTDEAEQAAVVQSIATGSIVVNDVRCQLFYESLPFGGVGPSGMGRYRGQEGFRTFSNAKTVLHQRADESVLAGSRPPFGEVANEAVRKRIDEVKARVLGA